MATSINLKLKNSGKFTLSTIILLKVYYDKLSSKVKINNVLSKLIKLTRVVVVGVDVVVVTLVISYHYLPDFESIDFNYFV